MSAGRQGIFCDQDAIPAAGNGISDKLFAYSAPSNAFPATTFTFPEAEKAIPVQLFTFFARRMHFTWPEMPFSAPESIPPAKNCQFRGCK
ncbi:hypothetical protein [Citrifermentans bremense]|uniref:hypothetical protein n=1 Tax=Citrifermentans bremense TaxID=60035 RepID=UPI001628BE7F|nr:hypothetical protein [Citrifermentans bremense]